MHRRRLVPLLHPLLVDLAFDRQALLASLPRAYVSSLKVTATPTEQVLMDLEAMATRGVLPDGTDTLRVVIETACLLAGIRPQTEELRRLLHQLDTHEPNKVRAADVHQPAPSTHAGREGSEAKASADLGPSRIYFSEMDRIRYSQVAWTLDEVDEICLGMERKLKLFCLVKGHVVIPASHLIESELAREIIEGHPRLFSSGIVVPALRSDFATCQAFLEAKSADPDPSKAERYESAEARAMASMMDASATLARWDVGDASAFFQARLVAEAEDPLSLLRSVLRRAGFEIPSDFRDRVAGARSFSREAAYKIARNDNVKVWQTLCDYADFIYYLGGARAVDSEGVLPQAHLLDFKSSELVDRQTRLSEHEVFFKLFVEAVKAVTSTHFPVDLLDALPLDELVDLHEITASKAFVDRYDAIQRATKEGLAIHDSERLVLLMDELEEMERSLSRNFVEALRGELPPSVRRKYDDGDAERLHALPSLVVSRAASNPAQAGHLVAGLGVRNGAGTAQTIESRVRHGIEGCETLVAREGEHSDRVLGAFVDTLKDRYVRKVFGAS